MKNINKVLQEHYSEFDFYSRESNDAFGIYLSGAKITSLYFTEGNVVICYAGNNILTLKKKNIESIAREEDRITLYLRKYILILFK